MDWHLRRRAARPAASTDVSAARPARVSRRPATFAAFEVPIYRRYFVGLVLYVLGHRSEYVTYAWIVWELTTDPLYLGLLGLAQGAPYILLQLGGGVVADRTNRLVLLRWTTLFTATGLVVAFALSVTGLARVEHLLVLAALSSAVRSFDDPSRQALLPQLVDRARLPNAVALGSIPWQGGRVLGPSIAGVLIAALGGPAGFAFAAGCTFAALGVYSRLRVRSTAPTVAGGVAGELMTGLRFLGGNYLFRSLIGLALFNSLFGMSYLTLLPIFADRYFDAGSEGYGLLQAATGAGSIAATLLFATLAHHIPRRGMAVLIAAAGFGLLLILFSLSASLPLAFAVLMLVGAGGTLYMTQINALLQERVPDQLRGRVMSAFTLCYNMVPFGGVLAGGLAAAVDARFAVLAGGALVAATALLILVSSSRLRAVP